MKVQNMPHVSLSARACALALIAGLLGAASAICAKLAGLLGTSTQGVMGQVGLYGLMICSNVGEPSALYHRDLRRQVGSAQVVQSR